MSISKEFRIVKSSKPNKCKKCGAEIPARTECLRYTVTRTGSIHYKLVSYFCMACERLTGKNSQPTNAGEDTQAGAIRQSREENK